MCIQNCDRFKIPLLPKVKNITQDLGFDELAMTQVTVTMLTIESTRNSVVLFFLEAPLPECKKSRSSPPEVVTAVFLIIQASVQDHDADCSCDIAFGKYF